MNFTQDDFEKYVKYFAKRNWKCKKNEKGLIFFKKNFEAANNDFINTEAGKIINGNFENLYDKFRNITIEHFSSIFPNLTIRKPENIYKGYNNNSFVSTGLEYYYEYLYKDKPIINRETFVIQPAIRFKLAFFDKSLYNNNDKYDYSSIAFNNISIVNPNTDDELIEKIENIINYLSKLGIHANRVNFVIENKVRIKENGVSYKAIKFFVDNLEIGDILLFKTKNGNLSEYGFGFERLLSRVINKKYRDLFLQTNDYDIDEILGANFLTVLCMFDNNYQNRGAKSKINEVLKCLTNKKEILNIELIYENYLYWNNLININSTDANFENVTKKYLKFFRK